MPDNIQRICKKCLLRDMEEKEYFANMYAYIDNLSKEDKVSEAEYQSRLELCRIKKSVSRKQEELL